MKQDPYWFFKKWGVYNQEIPIDSIMKKIDELEQKVIKLEDDSQTIVKELKNLENSLESRIDILIDTLSKHYKEDKDVQ
jgi:CRISPR/Cas system-associated endonuclease Cas3-HD